MEDLLRKGILFFNRKCFFEAHESWEDLWRDSEGELRLYYQGLVQVAVGLHHLTTGNLPGGRRVMERGLGKLVAHPANLPEIDNPRLIETIRRAMDSGQADRAEIRPSNPPRTPGGDSPGETV